MGVAISPLADGLLGFGATALLDEDGRPVAEVAAPSFRATVTDMAVCPYADVRSGGQMNRSALRQMSAVWPDLLACFSALAGEEPTVSQAWQAAVTGISLPLLAPAPTPRLIAGLFKASLGLSQVFSAMLLMDDGVADAPLTALGNSAEFFTALDAGRWLVGAEQVCAGSPAMIEQVFEAMVSPAARECPQLAADLIADVGALPPEIVGLHIAHLAALNRVARYGDGAPVVLTHPWLRAVFSIPDRPAEHALRLFPAGKTPESVTRYLAAAGGGANRRRLEEVFADAVAGL